MNTIDLKRIRLDYNLTQLQLAHLLDVSENTIRNYENGKTNISHNKIVLLANKLNTTEEYILGIKNNDINYGELKEYCKMFNLSETSIKKLLSIRDNKEISKSIDLFLSAISIDELKLFSKNLLKPYLTNESLNKEILTYRNCHLDKYYEKDVSVEEILIPIKNTINRIRYSKVYADYCNDKFKEYKITDGKENDEMIKNAIELYNNPLSLDDTPNYTEEEINKYMSEVFKDIKEDEELLKKRNEKISKRKDQLSKKKTTEINQ